MLTLGEKIVAFSIIGGGVAVGVALFARLRRIWREAFKELDRLIEEERRRQELKRYFRQ